MDITTMTEEQLKSFGYDQIALIDQCQFNLKAISDELKKRKQKPVA